MRLSYQDFVIRNAESSDCAQLAAWWNDGSVMAHAGFPLGLHTTPEKIEKEIADDHDEVKRRLIIESAGRPIGEMSCTNLGGKTAEIGIKICNPNDQEKGIGRIVLSMLMKHLFSTGYEKIILDTNVKNCRAQHVYELLGFRKIRVRENSFTDQLGEAQSSIDYELTPEEFQDYANQD